MSSFSQIFLDPAPLSIQVPQVLTTPVSVQRSSPRQHANRPAVALYERAQPAIPSAPVFNRPLVDPALLPVLGQVALDLGYGLA